MKKLILFIIAFFVFFSAKAQITQLQSDSLVLQRMSQDTQEHTILAKQTILPEFTITTSQNEILELDYSCWVYYVNFLEETNKNFYLFVKESNGNILQVKTTNDAISDDLAEWGAVKWIEIPFMEYILDSNSCQWINVPSDTVIIINSNEELENYIMCATYPTIDFDQYSLLLVQGNTIYGSITNLSQRLALLSKANYKLTIEIQLQDTIEAQQWHTTILVPKLVQNNIVALNINYIGAKVLMLQVDYHTNAFLGGKEFMFSKNSNSFTIEHKYLPPGDVGYVKLIYKEINELLFHAIIIWMGERGIVFPDDLLFSNQFEILDNEEYVLPTNGFEEVDDPGNPYPIDYNTIWTSVQSLVKVKEYLQSNPNQKVKIYLFLTNEPYEGFWIMYLKQ